MDEKKVDLTEVVEKVAKAQYERHVRAGEHQLELAWEDIPATSKYFVKEALTPTVVATLDAAGVKY